MRTAFIIAAAFATLIVPALASEHGRGDTPRWQQHGSDESARCPQRAPAEWLSVDQVTAKLKEQGYSVRKVERSGHGCYEVKATDANGVQVEMYLDPATAAVVDREGRS